MAAATRPTAEVVDLPPERAPDVISVLGEAFQAYPVMRFVLGEEGDHASRLTTLVTFFVMARVLRREPLLGAVAADGTLLAAAVLSIPGRAAPPPELDALRERTWAALGAEERRRYERFGAAAARFAVDQPHLHLNMIGTRDAARSQGLGRLLLEHVHARSAADPASAGVSLSTERASNVDLYRHMGYRVVGSAPVDGAFTTWVMFRPDRP